MERIITYIRGNKILFGLLIVGGILRLFHLDFQSAWLDELHTLNESNPNFGFSEVYQSVFAGEQMPVLYFYIVYFLFKIFGYSVVVLRMFSAILGIVSIYTTYILGKELFNKKVGLISALLIVVNIFHISYSQEGRPYIFLYLFTTLSFYYLIRFIKLPTIRNAVLYGLFTGLMLYGHFFAIFSIFAQYLFLLFILFLTVPKERKSLVVGVILSGVIVLILHIPSIKILLNISNISSFWVQKPTLDIYNIIFNTFFGNAEMLLFLVTLVGIFYFIVNFLNPIETYARDFRKENLVKDKLHFSFLLFVFWAVITMIIPLIRSYLKVPMIVDRYFITLLPLIILILAIGIEKMRSVYVKGTFLVLIVLFSLTDITVVKKYYFTISKSEFRTISKVVESNKKAGEKIYSNLTWYYSYYLDDNDLVQKSLDEVVTSMSTDKTKTSSFWFIDGHVNTFKVSDQTQLFLDTYYDLEQDVTLYGAWAKRYILKSQNKSGDVSIIGSLAEKKGDNIIYGIDNFQYSESGLTIDGWATLQNYDADNSKISIVIISDKNEIIKLPSQQLIRKDVTLAYKSVNNYDYSGFKLEIADENIPIGTHEVGILIKNSKWKKEGLVLINQKISKIK